ncbi:restriction endonuclease [Altibacter lentus]|uniref:restriction endonuclease n=1 Tax=Altibacter lentus TaxID=1223410 RepID=UPI00054F5AD4|nr:restriction endonuclease [Altibacter lentus]
MKLVSILEKLGSLEKNSFIKIIDNIIHEEPVNKKEINSLLNLGDTELKKADSEVVAQIFTLVKGEFKSKIEFQFSDATNQLDVIIDILIRDGNCIMKTDWLSRLYDEEIKMLKRKVADFNKSLQNHTYDPQRERDYIIYKNCLETAYNNDLINNRESKVTDDELSILLTLSNSLNLSQEEIKLVNYTILPLKKLELLDIIEYLKNIGVIFYSKKSNTIYVADEMVRLLRKVRNKEVADKYYRRVLRLIREPLLNIACRKHNIDWKQNFSEKVNAIINEGIRIRSILSEDIFKEDVSLTDRKLYLNEICDKGLDISPRLKGSTLDEKIDSLVKYFEDVEEDEKVGISKEGYEKLIIDLKKSFPKINSILRKEFQLQEENVCDSDYLLDYNIKPRDVLELLKKDEIQQFCKEFNVSTRGDEILNILDCYKDLDNLLIENYSNLAFRDFNVLKENGIEIGEAGIGLKFEEITKDIFKELGFDIDEKLKASMNTSKDKIDIILNLGNSELILVECKTKKDKGYNNFSQVSRQLQSYYKLIDKNNYTVVKSLLIGPEFTDDFISECELEYDLNLSLITASTLYEILLGFRNNTKHQVFPHKLLFRDVVISEERILKAIKR